MKEVKLKLQLNEAIYNEYYNYCLDQSNGNEKYAMALISLHIETMMNERISEDL